MLNEFVAYTHLGQILDKKEIIDGTVVVLQERGAILLTYALCGFANS